MIVKNDEFSSKKTLSEWIRSARVPYLNFTRNLPSQILLASLAWVVGRKLDVTHIDLSNAFHTSICFSFVGLFMYAAYSNASIFLEDLLPEFSSWVRVQETAIKKKMTEDVNSRPSHIPIALAKITIKYRKTELLIGVAAVWIIEIALAGAVVASLISATNFIQSAAK